MLCKRKNLSPEPGIETRFLGRPAHSTGAVLTELPGSYLSITNLSLGLSVVGLI